MSAEWFVLVESNTTGSGRLFCTAARRLGLRPVLLARNPGRYPYAAADGVDSRVVDTLDPAAVRAACAELGGVITGVTSSSEYFIATSAEVAAWFGLPHPDPAAVRVCRDKGAQRARLAEAGVPGAAFAVARTPGQAVAAAEALGLPVVVKPVAGSGSIATRLCADRAEVGSAASQVLDADPVELALPPQEAVLVEAYLDGAEFSVETLDRHVVGITAKHLGPEPYFVETGHDFPAPLSVVDGTRIRDMALAALDALGLGWGPAHVELRLTADGPRIVEVNPRLAGGMIPRMVEVASGIDLILLAVARVAGRADYSETRAPRATRDRAAAIRFLVADQPGRLEGIAGVARAGQVPGVVEVGLIRDAGADLVLRHSFQDRLAYVVAAGPAVGAAAHAAEAGMLALSARICLTEGSSY